MWYMSQSGVGNNSLYNFNYMSPFRGLNNPEIVALHLNVSFIALTKLRAWELRYKLDKARLNNINLMSVPNKRCQPS